MSDETEQTIRCCICDAEIIDGKGATFYRFDGIIKHYCRAHYTELVENMSKRRRLQLSSQQELSNLLNQIQSLPLTLRAVAVLSAQARLDALAAEDRAQKTGEDESIIYERLQSVSNQLMIISLKRLKAGDELSDEN